MASLWKRGKIWYVSYSDYIGRRTTKSTKTSDKATAKLIANDIENREALKAKRVVDPRTEATDQASISPLAEHLRAFVAERKMAGRADKTVTQLEREIKTIIEFNKWKRPADIEAEGVVRFIAALEAKKQSGRTRHSYARAIKQFTKWMVEQGRMHSNPLLRVRPPSREANRKVRRRMLEPDEWIYLRAAASSASPRFGMTGPERTMLYALAIQTGLRAGEVGALTKASVFADAVPPYVFLPGAATKNGKSARQFIKRDLADRLAEHIKMKTSTAPLFQLPPLWNLAKMLRRDLEAARQLWIEEAAYDQGEQVKRRESDFLKPTDIEGRTLDFHALRHTCGAWATLAGASPKQTQTLMRHSTINLTFDTYGHLLKGTESDAVMNMPEMLPTLPEVATVTATGADSADDPRNIPTVSAARSEFVSAQGAPLCATVHTNRDLRGRKTARPGTRTPNPLVKSQQSTSAENVHNLKLTSDLCNQDEGEESEAQRICERAELIDEINDVITGLSDERLEALAKIVKRMRVN